jgi:hypothetical protein
VLKNKSSLLIITKTLTKDWRPETMSKELTHKDICPYFEDNCANVGCVCPKYLAYQDVNDPEIVAQEISAMGVDPNGDQLTVMMEMQKSFAAKFHKTEGFTKDEVDHWVKAYDVCITDEITEVHEHLAVFPGIDSKDNLVELQKEFIDIWHFLMDEFIVANMTAADLINVYDTKYGGGVATHSNPLQAIFINEKNYLNKIYNGQVESLNKDENDLAILIYSNLILAGMRQVRQQISWKHWKKPSATIDYDKLHEAFTDTFRALVQSFILSGLDADELTQIYIKKNIENVRRQVHGY